MRLPCVLTAIAALAAFTAAACRDLPELGTCGNGIAEESNGEACDDEGESETCTATCELKCMSTAVDARYVDVATAATPVPGAAPVFCPGNEYRCGTDLICRAPSGFYAPLGPALPFDISAAPTTGDVDNDGLPDLVGTNPGRIYIRFASTIGTPLGEVVIQEAPSSDGPPVIFDPRPATQSAIRSELLFAVPTEGIALLQSDDERFAPEPEVPIALQGDNAIGLVVRDPDLVKRHGDVVVAVEVASPTPEIAVGRARVPAPDGSDAIAEQALAACTGAAAGAWRLVDAEAAGDRRSFVVVTQRDGAGAEPWHVCRYTHAGGSWADAQHDYLLEAPIREASLANLDGDECLELVLRSDARLLVVDAAGPACSFAPAAAPLPFAGELGPLLAAGPILAGGVDELVLAKGVYRACSAIDDCGASAPGTFVLAAQPTSTDWAAAVVVDLNRDGFLDVVAGREGQVDVDIVRGGVTPNVYRASTAGPVRSLVAGDFDGDRLGDVAMAEGSPMGTDRILVLFGSQEATVGEPRAMSGPNGVGGRVRLDRFSEMRWLPSSRGADGIDDLAIVRPGTPTRAGFMLGDAARLMTTPRLPPTAVERVPLAGVAAGAFRTGEVELLAFSGERALFYNAANLMNARWSSPSMPGPELQHPVAALRDGPRPSRGAALEVASGNKLVVFSVRGGNAMGVVNVIEPACEVRTTGMFLGELRGIDVDGDGVDEVAAVSDNGGPDSRRLQIFGAGCQERLADELAGCVDVARTGRGLVALCRLGPDPTGDPNRGPARGVFSIKDRRELMDSFVVGDARFATPGDYDGDGVIDVAISLHRVDEVVIHLLRQCPAHDTRGCPLPASRAGGGVAAFGRF
ncbi:MAG TPA: VCBS repeat-containing protein [Kofleriaceae bacterium]|nr:VCBS repeat-containing protein [Kofleriaceae bacterium]